MRRKAAAVVLAAATATGGVVVGAGAGEATPSAQAPPPNTAEVARGKLSDRVSQPGILTLRARPDGSPYAVINQAHGVYTRLPERGGRVGCGAVLYRVDDEPVVLLCGTVPVYRDLAVGDAGRDVRQLNRNLRRLGHDAAPGDAGFTPATEKALEALQRDTGSEVTGVLDAGDAVFLPGPVRVAEITGALGGAARPGASVMSATSDTPEVRMDLEPTQQDALKRGDRARITLPDNTTVTGRVGRIGSVARASSRQGGSVTIPASIRLDRPARARGLDRAPVQVDIATRGVEDALSVPVTALAGRSGGGFAVEVVRGGGRRELVAVAVGLFDAAAGRVQVEGDLREGDDVVVPSL